MSKAIFSDVDGTLAFGDGSHGVKVQEVNDSTYIVTIPDSSRTYQCYDISTEMYHVYFALNTRSLLRTLQRDYDIVIATGARLSTVELRKKSFDFVNVVILENGGMILDGDYQIDREWEAHLEPERKYLGDVKAQLESQGWVLDDQGRTSALRVRPRDNDHRTEDEFKQLCQRISLPDELKTTINFDCLDIILTSAGKAEALRYLAEKNKYTETIGIGDDINDMSLLSATDKSYLLRNAPIELRKLARRKGWFISKKPFFNGIEEILQHILTS